MLSQIKCVILERAGLTALYPPKSMIHREQIREDDRHLQNFHHMLAFC